MARETTLKTVGGVAAIVLAVSVIAPALRRSTAQDAAPGPSLPAIVPAPVPVAAPMPTPAPTPAPVQLAQLPTVADTAAQPPATAQLATPAPADAAPPAAAPAVGEERLQLRTLSAAQFHQRIELVFGRPAPLMADDGSGWLRFTVDTGDAAPVLIAAQPQTGEVRIVGRVDQLLAWRQIVAAVDAPAAADRAAEVFAAPEQTSPEVRQTVNLHLAQLQAPAEGDAGLVAGLPAGLLGPVEIVNIQGTDLFIIQGNPRDVARALEIINQIQEMARVSEPRIVVRPLQYVDSQAIGQLLTQLFAPPQVEGEYTLGAFYGRLLALPLGRPNSVLLVGGPGVVAKAEEILQQLDSPAEAATQFEVFRLKFARAEQAQLVVEQLFTAIESEAALPATFNPKALVIAELRTNALIVRASPADMAEVRELILELDQAGGETVNEIRVFKLKFSLAATLAPVLQRAVRGEGAAGNHRYDDTRGPGDAAAAGDDRR